MSRSLLVEYTLNPNSMIEIVPGLYCSSLMLAFCVKTWTISLNQSINQSQQNANVNNVCFFVRRSIPSCIVAKKLLIWKIYIVPNNCISLRVGSYP